MPLDARCLLVRVVPLVLAGLLALPGMASALCPSAVPTLQELTCSSTIAGNLAWDSSELGGSCSGGDCYQCGTPYVPLSQLGPE